MKYLWRILAVVNALAVLALWVCAYSATLNPNDYPNWSYIGMIFPAPLVATVIFLLFWLFVKVRYALISAIGMVLCWGSIRTYFPINIFQGTPDGSTIKVLSYNVMMFAAQKEPDNPIMRYIIDSDADIVCLQEPAYMLSEPIYDSLSAAYPYIETCYEGKSFVAVLSKMPILESHSLGIVSTSNLSCSFKILLGTDTLTLINSHLESYHLDEHDRENYGDIFHDIHKLPQENHRTEIKGKMDSLECKLASASQIRAVQADSIDSYVSKCTSKYIISCGDFNDCSISYVHKAMSRHLNDAYTMSGNGVGFSFNQSHMYFRIDNILVNDNLTPYNAKVDNSIKESDHYPIICTLEY